jgi:hypothetical protein
MLHVDAIDMSQQPRQSTNGPETVLVTAFFDVGRSGWRKSPKDTETFYMASFQHYLQGQMANKMVVFLDKRLIHLLPNNIKEEYRVQIIPIDYEWLETNTKSWQQRDTATRVMQSTLYKTLLQDRIKEGYPENIYPEYNLINHSKIDFIVYAIKHGLVPPGALVAWTDFGYHFSVYGTQGPFPDQTIRLLTDSKLTFCLVQQPTKEDADVGHTLTVARPTFTGGFFGGPQDLLLELHTLYHACLDVFYTCGIADDDQHIYLRCWLRHPELFQVYLKAPEDAWPRALSYFTTA